MDFYEVLNEVVVLLQQHGRVSHRGLKRQSGLDLLCRVKGRHSYLGGPEDLRRHGRLTQGLGHVPH